MKANIKRGKTPPVIDSEKYIQYYHPNLHCTIIRRKSQMPHQPQNDLYKQISLNLKALNPSPAYKSDFQIYTTLLRQKDENLRIPSWYPLFVKLMWNMQAKYPEQVDLKTITKEEIISKNLPCRSVKAAIEDGLLTPIESWEFLDHII